MEGKWGGEGAEETTGHSVGLKKERRKSGRRAGKRGLRRKTIGDPILDTSTSVSAGCLWRGEVPGRCIPGEERRLTFLGYCSMESYERGGPSGVHLLTGCNGEEGRKSDLLTV